MGVGFHRPIGPLLDGDSTQPIGLERLSQPTCSWCLSCVECGITQLSSSHFRGSNAIKKLEAIDEEDKTKQKSHSGKCKECLTRPLKFRRIGRSFHLKMFPRPKMADNLSSQQLKIRSSRETLLELLGRASVSEICLITPPSGFRKTSLTPRQRRLQHVNRTMTDSSTFATEKDA